MRTFAFQYYDGNETVEDTGLITMSEGMKLYEAYEANFKARLLEGFDVEMALWTNMDKSMIYSKAIFHINRSSKISSSGRIYEEKREYIDDLIK